MQFGIHATGSDGDIRPFIALGAGLRQAGHEVSIAVHPTTGGDYGPLCQRLDIQYIAPRFAPSLDATSLRATDESIWETKLCEQWRSDGHEDLVYSTAVSLCRQSDVVISHYLSYPTKAAAIKADVPLVSVQLTHEHTRTRHRPPFAELPDVTWDQLAVMRDAATRHLIDGFWARHGLPPFRHVTELYFSSVLNILAVSPTLCEPQPDWDGLHVVTGLLDLPAAAESPAMPSPLREFLDSGPPPVFMTLGSTQEIYPGSHPERNVALLIGAAVTAGCRAVIQAPPEIQNLYPSNTRAKESEDVFLVGRIPYSLVLSESAALVHHGGVGTLHLALRCGCPSVIVFFTGHHWFLGSELHRLGAAPQPIGARDWTAAILAERIREILDNDTFTRRASEIGSVMRGEDGVARGVAAISSRIASGVFRAR